MVLIECRRSPCDRNNHVRNQTTNQQRLSATRLLSRLLYVKKKASGELYRQKETQDQLRLHQTSSTIRIKNASCKPAVEK